MGKLQQFFHTTNKLEEEKLLKSKFAQIIAVRKKYINDKMFNKDCDKHDIINLLSKNYAKTISFLKKASYEEIGCSACALPYLIEIFPTQDLLDCFKSRVDEFAEHDKEENWNKPSIIVHVFKEAVEEAEAYLLELTKNK